jgi:hypothetical protein
MAVAVSLRASFNGGVIRDWIGSRITLVVVL